jgi:hypothetical protein
MRTVPVMAHGVAGERLHDLETLGPGEPIIGVGYRSGCTTAGGGSLA